MKIFVDIDGTIFTRRLDLDYSLSEPLLHRIEKLNNLYEKGYEIIYWTARGTKSGIDYSELTIKQLNEFGVKYTDVIFGKHEYYVFIDDKNLNAEVLDTEEELITAIDKNLKKKLEFRKQRRIEMTNKIETTHLSDQALGAIMIALQNSLLHQTDIVPILKTT